MDATQKTLNQARLMVTFARIVEAGSISAAATQCGIDKASVSRQLSELEDLLGVRLLNRSTRHLSLTDVGRVVFDAPFHVSFEAGHHPVLHGDIDALVCNALATS